LLLKALRRPPHCLLISVELRCFDRYKIVYSPKPLATRSNLSVAFKSELSLKIPSYSLACRNGEQVTGNRSRGCRANSEARIFHECGNDSLWCNRDSSMFQTKNRVALQQIRPQSGLQHSSTAKSEITTANGDLVPDPTLFLPSMQATKSMHWG